MKCILFSASWCLPCKTLQPIWDKLIVDMPDVEFVSVDIDEEPELAKQYSISAVPTILFIKDGVVADSLIGLHKEADIEAVINSLIKTGSKQ